MWSNPFLSPPFVILWTILASAAWPLACGGAPAPASADDVEIRLFARPPAGPVVRIALPAGQKLDQNAAPFYAQAVVLVKSTPASDPLDELREDGISAEGHALLAENRPAMDKLREAARCTRCVWDDPPAVGALAGYRTLARLIVLQVRADIAARRYPQAAQTLSAGYAMVRALTAENTELIAGLVGVAIATMMNEQALWALGRPGIPVMDFNGLPIPLIDLESQIKRDQETVKRTAPNALAAVQLAGLAQPAHNKARALAARVERQLDVLRAVQTLWAVTARSNGQLPASLPPAANPRSAASRPASGLPLTYKRISPTTATITVDLPAAPPKPDQITYRLTVAMP